MKKIGLIAINKFGCGYYRLFIPFKELVERYPKDYEVQICFTSSLSSIEEKDMETLLTFVEDKDIIVIQRRTGDHWEKFAKAIKAEGIRVIYELDDTYEGIPLENLKLNAKYMCKPETQHSVHKMLELADVVTVSTPELEEWCIGYCEPTKVHHLKNTLNFDMWPEPHFGIKPTNEPTIVGYAGSESHKTDLTELGGSLNKVSAKYNKKDKTHVLFCFFGFIMREFWSLEPHVVFSTGVPFLEYPQRLGGLKYDIGLAPLKNCFFNTCKSELRFLEYGALGTAVIATDIAPFRRVIKDGHNGLVVKNNSRRWASAINRLIEDTELRKHMGREAHRLVYNDYNIKTYVTEWHKLYKTI